MEFQKLRTVLVVLRLLSKMEPTYLIEKLSKTRDGRRLRKMLFKQMRKTPENEDNLVYLILKVLLKILELAIIIIQISSLTCIKIQNRFSVLSKPNIGYIKSIEITYDFN